MPYLPHPSAAASGDPWTIVVLAWRRGSQHRIDFVRLLRARYGLGLAEAKSLMEETLEAPIDLVCLGSATEREARDIATTADALGVEVRVVPGDDAGEALAEVRQEWAREHPRLMALRGPEAWSALAAVAAGYRQRR